MKDPLITSYTLCKFNFFNDSRFCIFLYDPGLKGLAAYPCEKTRLIKIWSLDFTVSEQHWTGKCQKKVTPIVPEAQVTGDVITVQTVERKILNGIRGTLQN